MSEVDCADVIPSEGSEVKAEVYFLLDSGCKDVCDILMITMILLFKIVIEI